MTLESLAMAMGMTMSKLLDFARTQAQLQGITCLAQIPLTLPNPSLPPSSVEQLHTNHVPGLSSFVLLLRETSEPRVLCADYLTP